MRKPPQAPPTNPSVHGNNQCTCRAELSCFSRETELKVPIRIAATGFTDMDDSTKPTKSDLAGAEKGPCCLCPTMPEEKDRQKDERIILKVFENFLHNAIFLPRYSTDVSSS